MYSGELIIDVLGYEKKPENIIKAAFRIFQELKIQITLVGDKQRITDTLNLLGGVKNYFNIIHTNHYIRMEDSAYRILSENSKYSIQLAMEHHKITPNSAFISAGHTGAIVLSAKKELGMIDPVKRAALCQILPCDKQKHFLLIDVGASITATSSDLYHWGLMGYIAAQSYFKIKHPTVGLLNIGVEYNKGGKKLIRAAKYLGQSPINFIGNIEGNDIWSGKVNVVITNGFTGNALLKSSEKLAAIFSKNNLEYKPKYMHFSPEQYSGALLLGIKGVCVICHGKASENDLYYGMKRAFWGIDTDITYRIETLLSELIVR